MSTNRGIRKGKEWIWYDDRLLVSVQAGTPDAFRIVLSRIPCKGGETSETLDDLLCAGAGGLRHDA